MLCVDRNMKGKVVKMSQFRYSLKGKSLLYRGRIIKNGEEVLLTDSDKAGLERKGYSFVIKLEKEKKELDCQMDAEFERKVSEIKKVNEHKLEAIPFESTEDPKNKNAIPRKLIKNERISTNSILDSNSFSSKTFFKTLNKLRSMGCG